MPIADRETFSCLQIQVMRGSASSISRKPAGRVFVGLHAIPSLEFLNALERLSESNSRVPYLVSVIVHGNSGVIFCALDTDRSQNFAASRCLFVRRMCSRAPRRMFAADTRSMQYSTSS